MGRNSIRMTKSESRFKDSPIIIKRACQHSAWANQNVNKSDTDRKMIDYCVSKGIRFTFRKPYFIHNKEGRIINYILIPFIFKKRIAIMFADSTTMAMKKGEDFKITINMLKGILGRKGRKLIILPSFDTEVLDNIFGEHPNWKTKVVGNYGI